MIVPYGFLKQFTELLLDRYKNRINRDYAFALAEVLLSACCWNIHFTNGYGRGQPNIWIQVILPSGDIKSTPINKFLRPILNAVENALNQNQLQKQKIVISQYTPESIINLMSGNTGESRKKKKDEETVIGNIGIIISDESSMLARGIKNKDYMSGLLEIDSMIYDGSIPERYTNTHGLACVPYCYKSKINATTPVIYGIMEEGDVIQGGWNRFDIVVGVPIDPDELKPHDPETFFQHRTQEEIDDELEKYATQLLKVIQTKCTMIYFSDTAAAIWCDYEYKQKCEALRIDEKDLRRGYKNRMAEKVLKRAVLYAVSRHIEMISEIPLGGLVVDDDEMEAAIKNQEEYYQNWQTMLTSWKLSPKTGESELKTDVAARERLKAVLQLNEYVSRQRVIEETGWNEASHYLRETLQSFIDEHKVESVVLDNSRALIEAHKGDAKWVEFQRVKLPVRGQAPTFYKWVGN